MKFKNQISSSLNLTTNYCYVRIFNYYRTIQYIFSTHSYYSHDGELILISDHVLSSAVLHRKQTECYFLHNKLYQVSALNSRMVKNLKRGDGALLSIVYQLFIYLFFLDPLPSPPRCHSMNTITSPTSQSTRNTASFRANIAGIDTTNNIPRQNSIGEDSNSSTSMIVVQFVENEHLQLQQTPSPQYIGQQKPKTEYDHLCLVSYQRIDSNECEKRMDSPIQ